ncbi:unnamed protein product [Knipowitschia caucasica]
MSKSGCAEVAVNAGKRSKTNPENQHPHSNIKKARRSEVNFLPNFPKGENQASLEQIRIHLKEEMEKTERDQLLIGRSMQTTFALRRQEIVPGDKPIKDHLTRWPALLMESQIFAEFHRITNVNLCKTFYAELDRHTQTLIGLYRKKASCTGKIAEALQLILREYDLQERQDVNLRRTLVLRALSIYLKEDDSDLFKRFGQDEESDLSQCPLALQLASQDVFGGGAVSIILEGSVVMAEISNMLDAFLLLFGLIFVFNMEYPKKLVNTFNFIQKILVCLDDNRVMKPCLRALKNELFRDVFPF